MDTTLIAGVFVVISLASTVLVKYATTVRTIRLREQLVEVENALRSLRGKFKAAENQKSVLTRELRQTVKQKTPRR